MRNSTIFNSAIVTAFVIGCLLTPHAVTAQDRIKETPAKTPQVSRGAGLAGGGFSAPKISIDFQGGTVAQYVQLLQDGADANKIDVNVVLETSAKNVNLPPISFRNVPVQVALRVVEDVAPNQIVVRGTADLAVIRKMNQPVFHAGVQLHTEVIAVKHILNRIKTEDMLAAFELGISLAGDDDNPPTIKLHKETGLLFVRGTTGQLSIVSLVTEELTKTMSFAPGTAGGAEAK